MTSENVVVTLVFILLGLYLIIYGIRMRIGYYKTWYMKPWARATSNIYMAIPGGTAAFLFGFTGVLTLLFPGEAIFVVNRIILGSCAVILIVGMLLPFVWPGWMKPAWLKWLEKEHGDILPILRNEANAMGYPDWEHKVSTQAGLEAWVAEVRRKYGLEER